MLVIRVCSFVKVIIGEHWVWTLKHHVPTISQDDLILLETAWVIRTLIGAWIGEATVCKAMDGTDIHLSEALPSVIFLTSHALFPSFLFLSPFFCKEPSFSLVSSHFEPAALHQLFRTMNKSREAPPTLRDHPRNSLSSSLPSLTGLTRSYPQFLVSSVSLSGAQWLHLKGAQWCAERSLIVTEWKHDLLCID